jgi:predicted nuclease of predicted toxin-antitoxin system
MISLCFLADMGVSLKTTKWLRETGYDSVHLREQDLHRLVDEFIIKKAREENRVILTFDLDFAKLMAVSNEKLPSLIIFRLENQKSFNQILKLESIIDQCTLSLLNGAIISVDETGYRVRYLPIKK